MHRLPADPRADVILRADGFPDAGLADAFGDHMVLQRGRPLPIWGWARHPGQTVRVQLAGMERTAAADAAGRWRVTMDALSAGGPFAIVIDGGVAASDVMVGDVWICAGQSNMEMGVDKLNGETGTAPEVIAAAGNPRLRLFAASQQAAVAPMHAYVVRQDAATDATPWQARWRHCTPLDIARGWWGGFSAIGYFFGREVADDQRVAVGLIQLTHGGTSVEAWTSAEGLAAIPREQWVVPPLAEVLGRQPGLLPWPELPAVAGSLAFREMMAPGLDRPPTAQIDEQVYNTATACFNGQVSPMLPMAVAGVLWYQGEHNSGDRHYAAKLTAMIADWRRRLGQGEVPFLIAQLCNWQAPDATHRFQDVREGQLTVARTVPGTALAVTIDLADPPGTGWGPAGIHPRNKQEVARRLALAAKALVYRRQVVACGPLYRSMLVQGDRIRLDFDHIGGGLVAIGGCLNGFHIAGADRLFVPAQAEISGDSVVVHATGIARPVAVRYGFACFVDPLGGLRNAAGLPASPFRTDTWDAAAR